jgi:hypothetical protein
MTIWTNKPVQQPRRLHGTGPRRYRAGRDALLAEVAALAHVHIMVIE